MLALARKRLPGHRWIHEMMERVELEETFDAAVCWDSLFHLPRQQYEPVLRKVQRWLGPGGRVMVSSGYLVDEKEGGFRDTMFGHDFFYDSLPPQRMVAMMEEIGFQIVRAEICDPPEGERNKGKWATVAAKIPICSGGL
jgi:cyclopropane fatty-acyl-phospholipid synthase-like methyltransferase